MKKLVCAFLSVLLFAAPLAQLAPLAYAEEPGIAVAEPLPEEEPGTAPEILPDGERAPEDEAAPAEAEEEDVTAPADADGSDSADPAADEPDADAPDMGTLPEEPAGDGAADADAPDPDAQPEQTDDTVAGDAPAQTVPETPETAEDAEAPAEPEPEEYKVSTMSLGKSVLLGAASDTPMTIAEIDFSKLYASYYNYKSDSNGYVNSGVDGGCMGVRLPAGENAENYVFTVQAPDGDEETQELVRYEEYPNIARWKYVPEKGGVYTVRVYKKGDGGEKDGDPLGTYTVKIYKVTFHPGNGEFKEDDKKKYETTYCENYAFLSFMNTPGVQTKVGEAYPGGTDFVGWMLTDGPYPKEPMDPNQAEKLVTNQFIASQQANGGSYEGEFYALIGTKRIENVGIYTDDGYSDRYDYEKRELLDLGELTYGYTAEEAGNHAKKLYFKNEGNVATTVYLVDADKCVNVDAKLKLESTEQTATSVTIPVGGKAELIITPRTGKDADEDNAYTESNIAFIAYRNNGRSQYLIDAKYKVAKKSAIVELKSIEDKPYGKRLTAEDVKFTVNGSTLEGVTLAQMGITVECTGFHPKTDVQSDYYPYVVPDSDKIESKNYSVTCTAPGGVKVVPATPTITAASASGIRIEQKLSNSTITATAVDPNSGEKIDGTFAWINGDQTFSEENSYSVDFTFTPDPVKYKSNYKTAEGKVQVTVSNRELTTIEDQNNIPTVPYDGNPHSVSFTASTEKGTNRTGEVKVWYRKQGSGDEAWSDTPPVNAGTYDVQARVPQTDDYAGDISDATLTITPKDVTLQMTGTGAGSTGGYAQTKTYDGTTKAELVPGCITINGLVKGDESVTVDTAKVNAEFETKNARDGIYVKVSIEAGANVLTSTDGKHENYRVNTAATLHTSGDIKKRGVTVALKESSKAKLNKEYGDLLTLTADDFECLEGADENSGLLKGESMADLHLQVTVTSGGAEREARPNGGPYQVTVSTDKGGGNYEVSLNESLTVTVVPVKPKQEELSAPVNGFTGSEVGSLPLTGTFLNPHAQWPVKGKLEWMEPDKVLVEGDNNALTWKFTPDDSDCYGEPLTGQVTVKGVNKPVPEITLTLTEQGAPPAGPVQGSFTTTYDKNAKVVNAAATYTPVAPAGSAPVAVPAAAIEVTYRFKDELADNEPVPVALQQILARRLTAVPATIVAEGWDRQPPVNAGIYEVQVEIAEAGDYAANRATALLVIDRAVPTVAEEVTAGTVPWGSKLGESTLGGAFAGVGNEPLTGDHIWQDVGGEPAADVYVARDKEYDWLFRPADQNYCSVTGKITVPIETDHRKVEQGDAAVYNLPADREDYAVVNLKLGADHYYPDDFVCFFSDPGCTDPISDKIPINKDGIVEVRIDTLAETGGIIYLRVSDSDVSTPVSYPPTLGFTLADIHIPVGEEAFMPVKLSDSAYLVSSSLWDPCSGALEIPEHSNTGARIKGLTEAKDGITVTATLEFRHPDPRYADTATIPVVRSAIVYVVGDGGSLTVTQNVTGSAAEAGREFNFTVTIKNEAGEVATDVNGLYGGLMFVNGVANFSLRAGERVTAWALPEKYSYTVVENNANADGYSTGATNATGTIVANQVAGVSFVNRRDGPPAPQGGGGSGNKAPAEDEYIVCEACGHHFWEPYLDGWRCTTCGHLRGTTGVPADAAAKAAQAASHSRVPQTADESNPALWVLVFLASAAGLGLTLRARKKRQ